MTLGSAQGRREAPRIIALDEQRETRLVVLGGERTRGDERQVDRGQDRRDRVEEAVAPAACVEPDDVVREQAFVKRTRPRLGQQAPRPLGHPETM